jgi:endonuclease-3
VANREFDINVALDRIDDAIKPFPKAMLFELAEDGFNSPFEQLVACMISIRTRDEVSLIIARNLFKRARTPREMARLSAHEIDVLIHQSSFHEVKAEQILAIARDSVERLDGTIPCDQEALMSFKGIGLKCANLILGIACGEPHVAVDVHVHRITNRWGFVQTKTPEQTSAQLEEKTPRELWVALNRELVPFGKHICTGQLPHCTTCPVLDMCAQVGVTRHR